MLIIHHTRRYAESHKLLHPMTSLSPKVTLTMIFASLANQIVSKAGGNELEVSVALDLFEW